MGHSLLIMIPTAYSIFRTLLLLVSMNTFYLTNKFLKIQYLSIFYYCLITFVFIFSPLLSPALPTPHLPHSIPPPLSLSLGPLFMFLDLTLPFFFPLSSSPLPRGHSQFVLYFHISSSVLLGTALPGFRGCNPSWLRLSQSWDHKPLRRQSLSPWQGCHLCPLYPAWP